MKSILYIVAVATLSLAPVAAQAQEQAMTLQQCIDAALAANLDMKRGEVSAERARAMQGTACDIDKTSVSLSQDPTSGGSPDNGITVSQSFEFPTVYAARHKWLKAETEVARRGLGQARNVLVRDVSACYYSLLRARRVAEILQAQDSICRKFVALASARHKAGEAGSLELMNAQRACSENLIERGKAEKAVLSAKMSLRQLLNTDRDVVPADTLLSAIGYDGHAVGFAETPLGEVYAARKTAAERSLGLARQGYMPSISVGFTTQLLIKGFNPYDVERSRFDKGNLMAFEVGVGVPLFWGAHKARVRAARQDVELAEISRRQAEQQQGRELADWHNELCRARRVLDYYTRQGLAQATEMARLSQVSYEAGEIGYVEYIQNQKASIDVQLQYTAALDDYNQAVIMLNYLNGNK